MTKFQDRDGRVWFLTVAPHHLREVRKELGVDLTSRQAIGKLGDDPQTLVATLHVLLEPQIKAHRLNPVDFARCLSGYALARAVDALLAELEGIAK
jgi:hypothetical protein